MFGRWRGHQSGEADCIRWAWEVEGSGWRRRCGMNNHLTGSGALDRDEGHAADLCNRSWSGMAASCVSSTHVKRIERSRRQRKMPNKKRKFGTRIKGGDTKPSSSNASASTVPVASEQSTTTAAALQPQEAINPYTKM